MNINFISRYKKSTILAKFFISLLSISAIAIILLAISMYYWFQEKSMVEINNANRLALSNIDTVMSGYLDTARRISMELYQSADIKSLILEDGEVWNDNVHKAGDRILSTMSVNTHITSIYVFSSSRVLLKPTNKVMPEKYENTFMDMVRNNATAQPQPWVLETASGKTDIISVFFKESAAGKEDFTGAVMVNMNMDILHGKIFANDFNKQQQLYIIDKRGRVLLQNDMENFGKDVSSEPFFTEIVKSGSEHGSIRLDISGKDYYLSYVTSANKEFYTLSIMEYGLSMVDLTRTRNIAVAVCLFILLGVAIASLVISYRIYKPIGNIFMNIRSLFSNMTQNQASMNEIQLASHTIAKIVERMNGYEKEKERNTLRKFFQKTGSIDTGELEESLRILDISGEIPLNYCMVVLRVGSYKSFLKNNTNQAIEFQLNSIETIASELFRGSRLCCHCCTCDDHIAVMLREKENSSLETVDLIKLLAGVQEAVQQMLGLEVTVGVSDTGSDIGSIRDKYREAYELTRYRLIYGKRSIIDSSAVKPHGVADDTLDTCMNAALEAVRKNSVQAFEDSVDRLISMCRELRLSCGDITGVFSRLASSMLKILDEAGISGRSRENPNSADIYKQMESIEDDGELKSWLSEIYRELAAAMSEINHTGIRDIVSKALEYITKNYGNPDVTANSMAERLSISPSYFSRIFKDCVGTSFPEYIINIRLEKAREILMNNDKPDEIKDICFKVGYSSTSYFTAAFKKKFGVTPSKYRLHHLSGSGRMSNL